MERDKEKLADIKSWLSKWADTNIIDPKLADLFKSEFVHGQRTVVTDIIYDYEIDIRITYIDKLMDIVLMIERIEWNDASKTQEQLNGLRSAFSNLVIYVAKAPPA